MASNNNKVNSCFKTIPLLHTQTTDIEIEKEKRERYSQDQKQGNSTNQEWNRTTEHSAWVGYTQSHKQT